MYILYISKTKQYKILVNTYFATRISNAAIKGRNYSFDFRRLKEKKQIRVLLDVKSRSKHTDGQCGTCQKALLIGCWLVKRIQTSQWKSLSCEQVLHTPPPPCISNNLEEIGIKISSYNTNNPRLSCISLTLQCDECLGQLDQVVLQYHKHTTKSWKRGSLKIVYHTAYTKEKPLSS